ncbi:MAG: alpha/beta fold hydrolase [Dehalococcoidia bacterium]|nr:alpha/beta fold hydrolase [Dehalococcoidia bacterium]
MRRDGEGRTYTQRMAYVDIDSAAVWYEDTGGEGPVVVLMHGAAGSSECWVEQLPALKAAGWRCITYDLRGFGKTKPAPSADAAGSMAGDLEQLQEALGLPPFFLVAQAYGGFGALEFALDNPDAMRALVVSTSFGGLTDPEFTALRAQYVPPEIALLPVEERELGATYLRSNPEGVARFLAMEAGSYRADGARQALRQPLTLSRLEGMRVPALLIAADEDVLAPPPVMRALAKRMPGSRFEVIESAGHCAYWEQPEVWNRLVIDFLWEYI